MGRLDLALGAAFSETAGDENGVITFQMRRGVIVLEQFRIDPFDVDLDPVGHTAMDQRLLDGFIGIFKLRVLADHADRDRAIGGMNTVIHILPHGQIGARRGRNLKRIQNGLIQPFAMIGEGGLVNRFQIIGGDHRLRAHVAEQGQLGAFFFGDRLLGPADQNIWLQPDGAQFLDRMLRRLGLQLTARRQPRQQRQMHKDALPAWLVLCELADRLEKGQALDITDGAADLAQHEIDFVVAGVDEILDFVGDMRNHLNRLAEIVAAPFVFEHVGVDPARRDRIRHARRDPGKAFVMPEVQIGFRAVVGDENLAMFKRAHRAGIDVQVGVQLAQTHRIAPRLKQGTQRCGRQPFAKGRHDAARDEDVPRHMRRLP